MKKAGFLTLYVIIIIILSFNVKAIVGVSPGIYEVDFKPGLKESYVFNFLFDDGIESEVYIEGDLADYVKINRQKLVGGGAVIASVELPKKIETPGEHKIFIGSRQLTTPGGNIGIVGNVKGTILIKVPYPGKYAEIDHFEIYNINRGEPINITLRINNLGKERISTSSIAQIFNSEKEVVEEINLGDYDIESTGYKTIKKSVESDSYKPGDYTAKAVVTYEAGKLEKETRLRIGTLEIGISNYTKYFEKEKINQFDIEVESFWNNNIENVYGDVEILGYDISFSTPSINVEKWSKKRLTGFFDTTNIKEKKFKANITINYADKKLNKIVDLAIKEEIDYVLYALIGGGIFLVIILIAVIVILTALFIRVKKNAKK